MASVEHHFGDVHEVRRTAALSALLRHARLAVEEIQPTPDEWRATMRFLANVARISDEKRQEWLLLCDVLGVSALVEAVNARRPDALSALAPFHVPNAPARENGAAICATPGGEPLRVEVRVLDAAGHPVGGAAIDAWQADQNGFYENQQPETQPEHNLRGVFHTDQDGRAWWRSVKPGGYELPSDGPVGALMRRLLGHAPRRPAHLSMIVRAPGFETLTTHVFDRADPAIDQDAMFAVKPELLADFEPVPGAVPAWRLAVQLRLAPKRGG